MRRGIGSDHWSQKRVSNLWLLAWPEASVISTSPELLLDAAVRHAKKHGAHVVEGYPVDPDSPSYRHMGFVPLFKAAGFREMGREGSRRHVVQLAVKG